MPYPSSWLGNTEPSDKSGTGTFKIKGVEFSLRFECFADYQTVSKMLDLAQDQGKRLAVDVLRSHIDKVFDTPALRF